MNKKIAGTINRFDFVKLMSYKFLPPQKWFLKNIILFLFFYLSIRL
jgi:hypothetical protein